MDLSVSVEDEENLARYVLSSGWLYKDGRAGCPIKPNAFMPHPSVKLSVYRIDDWENEEISKKGSEIAREREKKHREKQISLGKSYPDDKKTFRFLGYGKLQAHSVRLVSLDIVPEGPPRHANIINWPPLTNDRKVDEAAQWAYALKLQGSANFIPA